MAQPFTPGLLRRLSAPPRRVALVRASRIGDFICATPAFRALRAALPNAEMTMITLPILQDLVERSPHLDRFAPFPGFPGLAEQLFEPRAVVRLLQEMQAQQFDLAIQLQGSGRFSNPFTLLLGAHYTAGFVRSGEAPGLLDAAIPLPQTGHEIERVLAMTRFLGAADQGLDTEYVLWPQDEEAAAQLLAGAQAPLLAIHPGAWDAERRWPLAAFASAANRLQATYGGTIILIAGEQALEETNQLAQQLEGAHLNLACRTRLGVLGALLRRVTLLLTNDSGPAHIAYALRVPTVTVCNGTDIERYGPVQEGPFRTVAPEPAGNDRLPSLSVEIVVRATRSLLDDEVL